MIDKERIERIVASIKPKCPYCGADVTYAYYGYDGVGIVLNVGGI